MADEARVLGEVLGKSLREQEDNRRSSTHEGTPSTYLFPLDAFGNLKDRNLVITQRDFNASNSFILGHATNGVLGIANGMGGGQIVLGDDGNIVTSEIVRRRWEWNKQSEFNNGTKSDNITTENNDIRLR